MKPGDIALYHPQRGDWAGWLVCIFTLARDCHVRFITSETGETVEASFVHDVAERGHVQVGDVILSPPLTDEQRRLATEAALTMIGTKYGFLDLLALGLAALGIKAKWLRKWVGRERRLICSQLADLAWTIGGFHAFTDGRLPQDVNPGDLADQGQRLGWESYTYTGE